MKTHFDDAIPSEYLKGNWIYYTGKSVVPFYIFDTIHSKYKGDTDGKWLVFLPEDKIDKFWSDLKKAIEKGSVWVSSAKVSTKKTFNGKEYVVCVYTSASSFEKYVMTVREQLRELGIVKEIPYKTDEATAKGSYKKNGDSNISKYYN